jgi:3-oxoacyl-[acyl-carrier protein] reductase
METGLKGKVVIVAGASQGMGRAAAELFAAEGAQVAICARSKETLATAASEISSSTSQAVLAEVLDVTDGVAVSKFVGKVVGMYGRVDVCVANAGGPPSKSFLGTNAEDWHRAFELNFMSVFHFAHEVIPHMQKNRWGRFITITSTSVRQPIADLILSNGVRPSVVGLVKSMALEFGKDGITVNNVAPGYTTTERLNTLVTARAKAAGITEQEMLARWSADIPLRRLGRPEEVADAIVWLASERASYITGQTIMVDGGNYKGL